MPTKPAVRVFGQNETMDDLTAEQEELQAPQPPAEEAAAPPEAPAEPAPQQTEAEQPEPETRADKRIRQLLEKNAELERQTRESNERWARLDERQRQAQEARRAAEQSAGQPQNPYDKDVDPTGYNQWEYERRLTAQEQRFNQIEQQFGQAWGTYQQQTQQQQLDSALIAQANEFSRTVAPDYGDAVTYAAQKRMEIWQMAGYTPEQARNNTLYEAQSMAARALTSGKNAAEIFYNLAKLWGYKSADGNGNGARPTSATVSQAGRILAQVAKGQAMQGLSRGPGAGNEASNSYQAMMNMSAGEAARAIADMDERQFQRDLHNPALRPHVLALMAKLDGVDADTNYGFRR